MNKLNALGLEVLNHKIEMNKGHSELVKSALSEVIKNKLGDEQFSNISDCFLSSEISIDEFRENLFSGGSLFCKSKEELLEEFKVVVSYIENGLNWTDSSSSINIDKERFVFAKPYFLPYDFAKKYFGAPDKSVFKLMAKDGLVGRFATFRLPAIFKNIFELIEYNGDLFTFSASPAYFHEKNTYGIDLLVSFNIDDIMEMYENNKVDEVLEEIVCTEEFIRKAYEDRIIP